MALLGPLTSRPFRLALAFALMSNACSSKAPAPRKAAAKKAAVPMATKGSDGAWNIAATGSRFEPPIQIAAVPDKAWYCDMGTVHYAQSEAGDKTCKLCKMKLKYKTGNGAANDAGHHGAQEHHEAHEHHGH